MKVLLHLDNEKEFHNLYLAFIRQGGIPLTDGLLVIKHGELRVSIYAPEKEEGGGIGEIMTLCEDGHDEVCYEGRNCPVCEKMDEITELEKEIERLKIELDNA